MHAFGKDGAEAHAVEELQPFPPPHLVRRVRRVTCARACTVVYDLHVRQAVDARAPAGGRKSVGRGLVVVGVGVGEAAGGTRIVAPREVYHAPDRGDSRLLA